jgi:two-component system aerobic respiration control sensor histidine kinase ArcB
LWNLINNAVKFTARGSVQLAVSLSADDPAELCFSVTDTGIGIVESEQQRIFDMYYKSSDGRRLSIVGSGIGLSVSRALVEAMSGQIRLESTVGKGSTFIVSLPAELTSAPVVVPQAQYPALTILLIEDVPLNAEIATNLLEQRGHQVILAETGEDALALLETEDDIDLVLLDMQLPDMSGDQVARFIRAEPSLSKLPVVVLSANVRKAEQQLNDVRVDGALAKPINTNKLDQILHQLFGAPAPKEINAGTAQDQQILDQQTLDDYLQSLGKTTMLRSVQLFVQLLPGYINKMMETAVQQDVTEFQEAAHKLKGAAASVGLLWVQHQAKLMEQSTELMGMEKQLINFHITIERHLAALEEYIEAWV